MLNTEYLMPRKKKAGSGSARAGGTTSAGAGGGGAKRKAVATELAPPTLSAKTMYPKHLTVVAQEEADNQLLWARGALTAAECAGWIAFCEGLGPVSTRPRGGRPESGNAYRDNYRVQVHDIEIAEALWSSGLGDAIAAVLPAHNEMVPSGFNDNIRMYRYDPGLRFGKH